MKIGFYGATGSSDFGDYAMMIHNIQEMLLKRNDCEFYIFTPDKYLTLQNMVNNLIDIKNIYKMHVVQEPRFSESKIDKIYNYIGRITGNEKIIKRKRKSIENKYRKFVCGDEHLICEEVLDTIMNIDVFVFNGGGYLQRGWAESNYSFSMAAILAHRYGKEVYFLGNSIGPMGKYEMVLSDMLPCVKQLMVRDGKDYSVKVLEKHGFLDYINGPDDLSFVNDNYESEPIYSNYVLIEVMILICNAQNGEDYVLNQILQFINSVIEEGKDVVLISFDVNDSYASRYINFLHQHISNTNKIHIECNNMSMYRIFSLYKYCDFSLSFKYHPVILALGSNKPFIGVICDNDGYYEGKLKGACNNFDVPWENHIIHINDIHDEILIKMYCQIKNETYIVDISQKIYLESVRNDFLLRILYGSDNK